MKLRIGKQLAIPLVIAVLLCYFTSAATVFASETNNVQEEQKTASSHGEAADAVGNDLTVDDSSAGGERNTDIADSEEEADSDDPADSKENAYSVDPADSKENADSSDHASSKENADSSDPTDSEENSDRSDSTESAADTESVDFAEGNEDTDSAVNTGETFRYKTIRMTNAEKAANLTIEARYDDNGTNAVLSDKGQFGFQVLIQNLPLECMNTGMDIDKACVADYGNPEIVKWLDNAHQYMTSETSSHIGQIPGSDDNYFKIASDGNTCYTSFIVWLKNGESFNIYDIPEGAKYEVEQVYNTLSEYPPNSKEALFDVTYKGDKSGTVGDDDKYVIATNVMRTIDLKLSKEIFGYDDGRVFYLLYRAADNGVYDTANQVFTDRDGIERQFIHAPQEDGSMYTLGLIPFRPEDGVQVIKLPYGVNWIIDEYVPRNDVDISRYSYEDLAEQVFFNNDTKPRALDHGNDPGNTGSKMIYWTCTSGTNRNDDFVLVYKNESRQLIFEKRNASGDLIGGAKMQIVEKDSGRLIRKWVTEEGKPYIWNTGYLQEPGSYWEWSADKVYVLHEEEAPDGYFPTEDIEFRIGKHTGTTKRVEDNGSISRDAEYYYPYFDMGDGEEKFVLEMVDKGSSVTIKKTDNTGTKEIGGASLAVYKAEDVTDGVPNENAQAIDSWESEEDKSHVIEGKLMPGGEYVLVEISSPDGYEKAAPISFTANNDATPLTVKMQDDYSLHTVAVSKVNAADGKELEGAALSLLDKEGRNLDTWVSGKEPHVIEGLKPLEEYTLHEESAPDGYLAASDTTFTIDKTGKVTSSGTVTEDGVMLIEDEITKIKVSKVDIDSGKELEGAKIQIIDSKGNVAEEWVSAKEVHEIKGLKTGEKYTLHEAAAPKEYDIAADITFTIDKYGKVTTTGKIKEDGTLLIEDSKTAAPDKKNPEKPAKSSKRKNSSNTGDSADVLLWVLLTAGSAGALVYLTVKRKRYK